jgi:LmbE family N-acetylglucosaminyl deacetylase
LTLALAAALSVAAPAVAAQAAPRTLVALLAHPDDETPIGPMLARYAREGVRVFLIIATEGGQGTAARGGPRPDSAGAAALARTRTEEARCSAKALGAQPPILLGFPDGKLGDYIADGTLLYRLTARVAEELTRLRPDAVITWGPEGGMGHADHRLVSTLALQLARAGAPGMPQRLYYMYLPVEAFRTMYPQRGAPPLLVPETKHVSVRVPFTPADLESAQNSTRCHRSQFTPEALARVLPQQAQFWNGVMPLAPAFATTAGDDVFR